MPVNLRRPANPRLLRPTSTRLPKPPAGRSAAISGTESTVTKVFPTAIPLQEADAFRRRKEPDPGPGFAAPCSTADYVRKVHAGPGTTMKNPGSSPTTMVFGEKTACG